MESLRKEFPQNISVEIVHGDITRQQVDAIVNAANTYLDHGGGVARAIANAAGPVLQEESADWVREHGKVSHEEPAYTRAGDLPCKYVIHAVGPVWGSGSEHRKLKSAILGSLQRANQLNCKSIAFPAISTGIFGFPLDQAAQVFMESLLEYVNSQSEPVTREIRVVLYDSESLAAFTTRFKAVLDADQ